MSVPYDELVARLEALEQGISMGQLPMAQLMRKLETDWQPDSGVLLPPASIGSDLIKPASIGDTQFAPIDKVHFVGAAGEPAFQNAWTNFDGGNDFSGGKRSAHFWKDRNVVQIGGVIKSGATSTVAFTLPVGYRPPAAFFYLTPCGTSGAGVTVNPDGTVVVGNYLTGANVTAFTYLDGVSFRVA